MEKLPTPPVEIIKEDAISINRLVALKKAGYSVLRSAHVGNLSPYNLTLAQAGIPILSVDHMQTGKDKNYFPEIVASQDSNTEVAVLGQLACRTVLNGVVPDSIRSLAPDAKYLDELHIVAVKALIAEADIFTNTDYLRANAEVVNEIVSLALDSKPEVFDRIVTVDGRPVKSPQAYRQIGRVGIMQLNDDPRAEEMAVMMPNTLDIVANFVIETLKTEQPVQYHLSGPDMVNYIGDLMPDIQEIYAVLKSRSSFCTKLPESITVKLVPTAEARLATTMTRKPKLDDLISIYAQTELAKVGLRSERKAFFSPAQTDPDERGKFLTYCRRMDDKQSEALCQKIADLPELFITPGSLGFITQYDVLAEGGLYVPELNMAMTMEQLNVMWKVLGKL